MIESYPPAELHETIPPFGAAPPPSPPSFPANDRTWFAAMKQSQQREQRAEDELHHYEVMGAGLAVFCVSFWEALRSAEPPYHQRFSHEETLRLLEAALRGR